jgi:hypothetical protein
MTCELIDEVYNKYIYIIVSSAGLCLNVLCSLAFFFSFQLNNSKTDLFKYLKIKSLCDTITMLRNVYDYIYYYAFQSLFNYYHPTLGWCRFYIFFYYYVGSVVLLLSIFCEVGANFNRYRTMTNRFKFLDKIKYNIKIMIMILYCLLFYTYRFFNFECISYSEEIETSVIEINSSNISIFSNLTSNSTPNIYYDSKELKDAYLNFFLVIHGLVRDCIPLFIIILFSVATTLFTKNSFKKTRVANTHAKESDIKKKQNLRARKAQSNMTKMVLISNLILFIGHFFSFVKFTAGNKLKRNQCYTSIEYTLFFLAYSVNFFVYFCFNKHFRNFFFKPLSTANDEITQFNTATTNR